MASAFSVPFFYAAMEIRGMRFVGDVKRFFLLPNYLVRGIALKDFFAFP